MFNNVLSTAALALAASSIVSAQTFTDCDPTKEKCKAAPALGKTVNLDFTQSKGDDYLHTLPGTTIEYDGEKGAIFSIANEKQAPTKASNEYIFFGELHCDVQAAAGAGIVTSIVLQSDDLDEIDWEWIGNDNKQVQTNYFSKGDTSTWDRGGFSPVENPTGQFHSYGIVWSKEKIDWTIDGAVVRTLTAASAGNGKKYPQSPMQIKIGTWTAGSSTAPEGTVTWAGGRADFKSGPKIGYYKNCKIVDYMGGEKAATEYAYPDGFDGSWEQVIVKAGEKSDDDEETTTKAPIKTTTTTLPSSTSESEVSTTEESSAKETVKTTLTTAAPASSSVAAEASSAVSSAEDAVSSAVSSASEAAASASASTVPDDEAGASLMSRANLAMGAIGLVAAFML